jgi:SAM-dependent methyltransferase
MSLGEAWREEAQRWAAWARTPGHDTYHWYYNLPAFVRLLPPPRGITVDVGCGEGRIGRELRVRGHRVIGVDFSEVLATLAAHGEPEVPVSVGDGARLPIRSGVADLVVCYMVLQDVDDLEGVLCEIARILRPEGALCAAVVHPMVSSGFFAPDDPNHTFFLGGYIRSMRHAIVAVRDGLEMTFHMEHRPLETYSAALEAAGLVIEALREPVPDEDAIALDESMVKHRTVPNFLHLRARRV